MASKKQDPEDQTTEATPDETAPEYVEPAERTDPAQPMNRPRQGPTTGGDN